MTLWERFLQELSESPSSHYEEDGYEAFEVYFRTYKRMRKAHKPRAYSPEDLNRWLDDPVPLREVIEDVGEIHRLGGSTLVVRTRFTPRQYFNDRDLETPKAPRLLAQMMDRVPGWYRLREHPKTGKENVNGTLQFDGTLAVWMARDNATDEEIVRGYWLAPDEDEDDWEDLV